MKSDSALKYLSDDKKEEIEELVEIIYQEKAYQDRIDILSLLKELGITLSYGAYEDAFDGLLEYQDGKFHIFCNLDRLEDKENPRTLFTIAHELGHFYILEHREALMSGKVMDHKSFTDFQSHNPVEKEADYFASLLLMPEKRFRDLANKRGYGFEAIVFLAKEFGTSITSTALRYVSLDITPCLVIKWSTSGYQWKSISNTFWNKGYRKTIKELSKLSKDSATSKALAYESIESGIHKNGTVASFWFPFIQPGSYKDLIMEEQAFSLGRFGALTLISE